MQYYYCKYVLSTLSNEWKKFAARNSLEALLKVKSGNEYSVLALINCGTLAVME